jgi:hypothetical protein
MEASSVILSLKYGTSSLWSKNDERRTGGEVVHLGPAQQNDIARVHSRPLKPEEGRRVARGRGLGLLEALRRERCCAAPNDAIFANANSVRACSGKVLKLAGLL